jgi:hypothetical protein
VANTLIGKPSLNSKQFKLKLKSFKELCMENLKLLGFKFKWQLGVTKVLPNSTKFGSFQVPRNQIHSVLAQIGSLIFNSNSIPNFEKFQ